MLDLKSMLFKACSADWESVNILTYLGLRLLYSDLSMRRKDNVKFICLVLRGKWYDICLRRKEIVVIRTSPNIDPILILSDFEQFTCFCGNDTNEIGHY